MFGRLLTLIIKELLLALRDPQSRRLLLLPALVQLALFPFAATLEVRNATLAILNQDQGAESTELVRRLAGARSFSTTLMLHSQAELTRVVDEQRALVALEFPATFSRALISGRPAQVLAIVDGRRTNSVQIALSYVQTIVSQYAGERLGTAGGAPTSRVVVRNWFNPNLEYQWFMLPTLVALIATMGCLGVTALSIAREREEGTLDQLLVSPLTPRLILIGKTIPAIIITLFQATLATLAAVFVYHVPFHGSIVLLYLSMACYAVSLAGFGLLISSLCETKQQALLGMFSFVVPATVLSGFIGPIENMPAVFRTLAWIDPLSHFIVLVKGLFLKGYGFSQVWPNLWPLLLTTVFTSFAGYWVFRRRVA